MTREQKIEFMQSGAFGAQISKLPPEELRRLAQQLISVPDPNWRRTSIELVGRILNMLDFLKTRTDSAAVIELFEKLLDCPDAMLAVAWYKNCLSVIDQTIDTVK